MVYIWFIIPPPVIGVAEASVGSTTRILYLGMLVRPVNFGSCRWSGWSVDWTLRLRKNWGL